jgi:hypothetical protein
VQNKIGIRTATLFAAQAIVLLKFEARNPKQILKMQIQMFKTIGVEKFAFFRPAGAFLCLAMCTGGLRLRL